MQEVNWILNGGNIFFYALLILFVVWFQNEAGRLQLEGCLSDEYYKVRDLLYQQFAIIWDETFKTQTDQRLRDRGEKLPSGRRRLTQEVM